MIRAIATCILVLLGAPAAIAAEPAKQAEQISTWVGELNHENFAVREAATTKLVETNGGAALEAVVRAAESNHLESRWRAILILSAWHQSKDAAARKAVSAVLAKWSATKDERLVRLARSMQPPTMPSVHAVHVSPDVFMLYTIPILR